MNGVSPELLPSAVVAKPGLLALVLFGAAAFGAAALSILLYKAPHGDKLLLAYHFGILVPALLWYLKQQEQPNSAPFSSGGSLRPVAVVATLAFLCSAALSFQRGPGVLITDEQVNRLQARLMQAGMLQAAAPPGVVAGQEVPPELQFHHNLISPRGWTGMYPVVWPLLLALGRMAHAEWLVTPLLGALLIFLTANLGRIAFGPEAGLMGAIVMFPTPFFLVNTSGIMSHALAACLVAAALCLIESGIGTASAYRISAALALFGLCFFVRPFTSLAAGVGAALVLVLRCFIPSETRVDWRWLVRKVLLPAVGIGIATAALALLENKSFTGDALLSPYALSGGTRTPPEISLDLPAIRAHLPATQVSLILTLLHAAPYIFALAACAIFAYWRKRSGTCLLLLSAFAGSVALYAADLVPNISYGGQRMYFEGLPGIAVLAGAGAAWLIQRFRVPARALIVCAAFLAVVQVADFVDLQRDIRPRLRRTSGFLPHIQALHLDRAIVFMRPIAEPEAFEPRNFNPNVADWRNSPKVYLLDPGPDRRAFVTRAFNRARWVVVVYYPKSDSFVVESSGELAAPGIAAPQPN